MLEVRDLSKVYKSNRKLGIDTHALDHVSLRFPERGMVFLLGKSGSGKSTLLNVCGGLDAPTSGEVIVKGRSSKNFSQSDFDSYRNTYVGFIFQEYNILNEFTVEDNIALALELQGKPKDKKVIAELLEQVDLTGYAKRKPNTLSGGQKQRIAIARALVKAPEIIMADEPTGALDSTTGKQVFDTLKKLSRDKLVIVVSHDREFAELYADRIIELKDGKILSDVTKTQEKQEEISPNVTAIGDILCIKQGGDLTDEDFERIKRKIKASAGDVIIAGGERDVQNFKKVNRITENGEKEVFRDTDGDKIPKKTYTPEESRFIRSKLPAKHAAKIGVSGLKTKPVRLFFTILLCVVSFVLFGILSTLMLYNSESMFKQTLKDSDYGFVVFDKVYVIENSWYENGQVVGSYRDHGTAKFSPDEIEKLSSAYGGGAFGAIDIQSQIALRQGSSYYWNSNLTGAAYMPKSTFVRQNMMGAYPAEKNEVCISTYFADMIVECKTIDKNGEVINVSDRSQLIGKSVLLDGQEFKITGIFESGTIDTKFAALKDSADMDYNLYREFESLLHDGTHQLLGVSEEGLEWFNERYSYMHGSMNSSSNRWGNAYIASDDKSENDKNNMIQFGDGSVGMIQMGSSVSYNPVSDMPSKAYVSIVKGKKTLADNEAVVSYGMLVNSLNDRIWSERNQLQEEAYSLENIVYRYEDISNQISSYTEQLNYWNAQVAEIENVLNTLNEEDPMYWDYYNTAEQYRSERENYRSELAWWRNELELLFTEVPSEWNITADNCRDKLTALYDRMNELDEQSMQLDIIRYGEQTIYDDKGDYEVKRYSLDERKTMLQKFFKANPSYAKDLTVNFYLTVDYQTPMTETVGYTVVGVVLSENSDDYYTGDSIWFTEKVANEYWDIQKSGMNYYESVTNYRNAEDAIYTKLYVPYNHSDAQTNHLWDVYKTEDYAADDSKIRVSGSYVEKLEMIDSLVKELSTIFFYIGLVLAVFAILLFSNFISVSISQKRREIGILRAVGARSVDVFKIFFSESLVIAMICSVLAIVGSTLICRILNTEIGSYMGASIFVFGLASVLIIFAIALLTALLATFLPVWNAAKKKPVDSIRAL